MSEVEPDFAQQYSVDDEPLGPFGKALSLLLAPLIIPQLLIVARYWLNGQKKKSENVVNFMELGWFLWGAILALVYFIMK